MKGKRYTGIYKCSKCGASIQKGTRHYVGAMGGRYHISCGSHLKQKSYAWGK